MSHIVIALLRAVGTPFVRHHSALGVAAWILVLFLIAGVAYTAFGSFQNNNAPHEEGRHKRNEPRP